MMEKNSKEEIPVQVRFLSLKIDGWKPMTATKKKVKLWQGITGVNKCIFGASYGIHVRKEQENQQFFM